MKKLSVAVVGAGPAGLAAALYLARASHEVVIFDRFEAPRPVGSGLMLQPTGMAVLNDLGLASQMTGLGCRIDRLDGRDARTGRVVLDVAYRPPNFGLGVHRSALFTTLFDAVTKTGIPLRTSVPVVSCHNDEKGVHLVDETGEIVGQFDLAVDASGANSSLLSAARPDVRRRMLPYGAFWSTLDWVGEGFDPRALQQRYRRASVMVGVLPIGRQTVKGAEKAAFFWSLKPEEAPAVRDAGIDVWKASVRDVWPQTDPYLDQIGGFDDLVLAEYGHHTLKPPYADRLAYIGDSAHSTSPQLGQGANMALLDAKALSVALDRNTSVNAALRNYAQLRRWHVRLFQTLSLVLTPFYQSDSVIVPLARDTLVATLAKVPPVPAILSSMVSGTLIDPLKPLGLETWHP